MEQPIIIPVVRVKQPLGEFFIGSINAKDLVKISFADVRRIHGEQREVEKYLGIQRPLDKGRVKSIKQYIQSPDATFPTGVVVAVDERCVEYDDRSNVMTLHPFKSEFEDDDDSIELGKIAKVLDGQHRIAAFTDEKHQYDLQFENVDHLHAFEFNVVIFVGIDIDEQANIFATVNLAQTKVNRSLVYDLEGLSRVRSPFRTAHLIAVALDSALPDSPLYHRIKRLGVKTKGRLYAEPLTQAGFVESLTKLMTPNPFADRTEFLKGKRPPIAGITDLKKYPFRNLFLQEKDNDIALVIFNYFKAIQKRWPQAWAEVGREGNILPKSNAFKAFMRFLRDAYLHIVGENAIGRIPSVDEFKNLFDEYQITDNDFTTGTFSPGSGGEAAFYKLLTRKVTVEDLKERNR